MGDQNLKDESGRKKDAEKLRMDLIPLEAVKGIARVLTKGAVKYGDWNWANGMSWSRVIAALERHLMSFKERDDIDSEWGLHHLDHVLANVAFLRHYVTYQKYHQFDDRQDFGEKVDA